MLFLFEYKCRHHVFQKQDVFVHEELHRDHRSVPPLFHPPLPAGWHSRYQLPAEL